MIFGGRGGQADKELKVELFNWRTGEQCQLSEQLPFSTYGHSAAVLDGVPVYCGGLLDKDDDGDKRCHKFLKETKTWEQVLPKLPNFKDIKTTLTQVAFIWATSANGPST